MVASTIIVKQLNVKQIKDLKETFLALDRGKIRLLNVKEVETGLVQASSELPGNEIAKIIANADFLKDGQVNYSEFITPTLDSPPSWTNNRWERFLPL